MDLRVFVVLVAISLSSIKHVQADTAGGQTQKDAIDVMLPQDYISDVPFEKIGIAALQVTLEFEDIRIPGPKGLDLVVNRTFNRKRTYPVAGFGDGWHLGIPTISVNRKSDPNAPLKYLGCIGYVYSVEFTFNNQYAFPVGFQNANQLKLGTIASFPDNSIVICENGVPVHVDADGVKTVFGSFSGSVSSASSYKPSRVIDLYGNYIDYTYETYKHPTFNELYPALKTIKRSDGARIDFEFEIVNGKPWIKRAYYLDREVQYVHIGLDAKLDKFIDQESQITSFDYNGVGRITSVKQPSGLEVTYGWRGSCSSDTALNCDNLSVKKISGPGIDSRRIGYIWSGLAGEIGTGQTVVTETDYDSVQDRIEKYTYVKYGLNPFYNPHLAGKMKKIEVSQNGVNILLLEADWQETFWGEVGCPRRVVAGSYDLVFPSKNTYCGRITPKSRKITVYNDNGTDVYLSSTIDSDVYGSPLNVSLTNTATYDEKHIKNTWYNDLTNWVIAKLKTESVSTDTDIYLRTYKEKHRLDYYSPSSAQKSALKSKYYSGRLTDTYFYHANGALKRHEKGASQRWVEYANYKNGTAQTISVPDRYNAASRVYAYKVVNDDGTIDSETNFAGTKVNFDYDKLNRLTVKDYQEPTVADEVVEYSYSQGQLLSTLSKGNYRKETKFDAFLRGSAVKEWDTNNASALRYSSQKYNHKGQIVFQAFPSSSSDNLSGVVYEYDGLQRIRRRYENINQTGVNWSFLQGNKVKVTDAKGNATTTTYRAFDTPEYKQAKRVDQPKSVSTVIQYNAFDNIYSVTQGGITETRLYDDYANLCKLIRPDVGTTAYSYNIFGDVEWIAEGVGGSASSCDLASVPAAAKIAHTYDNRAALHKVTYPDNTPEKVSVLNAEGSLLSLTAGSAMWEYEYNSLQQVEREIFTLDNISWLLDPEYNSLGHVERLTYPSGIQVAYAPNAFGQPTQVGEYVSAVQYYPTGDVKSYTYGNGLQFSQTLDELQRLDVSTVKKQNTLLIGLDHGYDDNQNITSITDLVSPSKSISLDYDELDRLDTASGFWGQGSFGYDALGNIKHKNLGTQQLTYSYDSNNRLKTVTGGYSFNYDTRGNVTNNAKRGFVFNRANQLVSSGTNSYQYDGYNRRVKKTSNGKVQLSLYNASGQLMMTDGDKGPTEYFYLGNKLIAKESSVITSEDTPGYTGHLEDDDLQLTYMQQRYYDPVIGRFYSNDPVGFSPNKPMMFNRYAYAYNSPYVYIDPDGMDNKWFRTFAFISPSSGTGIAELVGARSADEANQKVDNAIASASEAATQAINEAIPSPYPEQGTIEYGGAATVSLLGSATLSCTIAMDSEKNIAVNLTGGAGLGGFGASAEAVITTTSAGNVSDLQGAGGVATIGGGEVFGVSTSFVEGTGYMGQSTGAGFTIGTPVSVSVHRTYTIQPYNSQE